MPSQATETASAAANLALIQAAIDVLVSTGIPLTALPGTSEADIGTLKADTALIKADVATLQDDIALIKAGIPLTASEAHIGEVGGNTILVAITPTIDAAAYHANDNICAIQTIANAVRVAGGTGILQSIVVQDLAAQNAVLQIFLFSANPGTGTYTKNAECDLDDTDAGLCIGMVEIAAADYKTVKDNSIAVVLGIGLPIKCVATSLFAVIKTTGTPTYVSTSDLKLTFGILRD